MKGITIPCIYMDEGMVKLKNLNADTPIEDMDEKDITFYKIDGVTTHKEDEISYTEIFCNGEFFLSRLPLNTVKGLINEL